jgi:hypothetical protein
MATAIVIGEAVCTLDFYGDGWTCESDEMLEGYLNLNWGHYEVSGADPNPPYSHASQMADALGGTVTDFDAVKSEPDVVY